MSRAGWDSSEGSTFAAINAGSHQRQADAQERIASALERIANVLQCPNASGMARAIIRMDKRMAKRTKL